MSNRAYKPIPANTPYTGPGRLMLLCVPDDDVWFTAVREAIRQLTRGRYWDRDTGVITDAQAIGYEVYNSIMDCTALLTKFDSLIAAVNNLSAVTSAQSLCCDNVSPPVPVDPPPTELPPADPIPQDVPPAYGGDPAAYNAELCRMANALHWMVRKWLVFLAGLEFWGAAIALLVSLALILFPEPASTAIGSVTLATILGYAMGVSGGLDTLANWAEGAVTVWDSAQQNLVCLVYGVIGNAADWKEQIVDEIVSTLETAGGTLPGTKTVRFFVSWLVGFMDYFEDSLYNLTSTLESHENPVDCNCDPPCNSCQYNRDGVVSGSSSTFVYTGDLTSGQPYRTEWDPDNTRFYLLAQGGGFQPGRFRFPDTIDANCSYCVELTITGNHAYDAYYCAKHTDSNTFSTSEVQPASIVMVPAGNYNGHKVMVPIDPGGQQSLPLTLGIKADQQSNAIVSIRVRWEEV